MSTQRGYVLGTEAAEIARLDAQAATIAAPTRLLLQVAGIGKGMRVLDLGTGLGHVAFLAAELAGPDGAVVGVDQAEPLLEVAEQRRLEAGADNVAFEVGDARSFRVGGEFDAVIARLLLFHLADPVALLRHHLASLRSGGVMLAIDFDVGSARSEPPVELVTTVFAWIERAFEGAGASPRIGARLGPLLREAGLADVRTLGAQVYLGPDDPQGSQMLAGVVRTLAAQMPAGADELGADTLEPRLAEAVADAGAVVLPPALAGAWGRRP
jgi:SAM-dependent methyltransferase